MNEVMGRAAAAILDSVRRLGLPTEGVLARLPVSEAALREPTCRIDWTVFAELLDEIETLCGGGNAFEHAVMKVQPTMFSDFLPLVRFMLSPRDLYRLVHALLRIAYLNVQFSEADHPDGRLVVTVDIPAPHRPCPAFFHACAGGMRSVPEILGLPHVDVVAELTPRRGVFTISLPESRTFVARLRRASVSLIVKAAVVEVEHSWMETRRRIAELETTNARLVDLTRRLEAEAELRNRAEVALRAVADAFAGSVFLVTPSGRVSALDDTARAALDREGEALVGRVARAAAGASDDPSFCARAASQDGTGGHIVLRTDAGSAFATRLERGARTWRLTARHIEVTALVVRGLSNKDIAARLDCAMHTVELHVTEVLKRARVESRSALVAAFWSGT
jgi:DNA-binding CsgD family transcriptional regulator